MRTEEPSRRPSSASSTHGAAALGPATSDPLKGQRLLLGVSGGIAAVKIPSLVNRLVQRGVDVRCLLTPSAERLVSPVALASLSRNRCYVDADQWSPAEPRPLHISLAEWADLVLVAPLGATTLARWVHGLGGGLLASTLLASEAPVLAAAAMNTAMWASEPVCHNWQLLEGMRRVLPLAPSSGLLACDRVGDGRMVEPDVLILALESLLSHGWQRDWQGLSLLVSAGPTVEPIDAARILSNRSSGRMGVHLAQAARLRGAHVTLVHGPLRLPAALCDGLARIPVETAEEMADALRRRQPQVHAVAMAAAVGDLRRSTRSGDKLPKEALLAALADGWEPVPDVLADLVDARPKGQVLLGFAAQTGAVVSPALEKHLHKGCDLLFANPIDRSGIGFLSNDNAGWLLGPGDQRERLPRATKLAVGHRLLTAVRALLPGS